MTITCTGNGDQSVKHNDNETLELELNFPPPPEQNIISLHEAL